MADEAASTGAANEVATETPNNETSTLLGDQGGAVSGSDTTQKAEGQTEEAAKAEGAPEKYEWAPIEGVTFDAEILGEFEPLAREMNLTNDQANKLIPLAAKMQAKQVEAWNQTTAGWAESAKTDKEIGGQAFDASLASAKSALARFGTPELMTDLNKFGIGNHPEFIRFCTRVGKAMGEDNMHHAGDQASQTGTTAQKFYPGMNP